LRDTWVLCFHERVLTFVSNSKEKCGFYKWIWGDRTDVVDDLSMIVPFFIQIPGWNYIVEGIFYQLF
jgi:hypothetical protein